MGWSSGSSMLTDIVTELKDVLDDRTVKKTVFDILIKNFEAFDCDTIDEVVGIDEDFDEVYMQLYPEEFEGVDEVDNPETDFA